MPKLYKKAAQGFVSFRLAAGVIAALFAASLAGWIAQELVPPDFAERRSVYAGSWGAATARFVELLRLYDPFHSIWYRFALALFFFVLLACVLTRWRQLTLQSLRPGLPAGADELKKRPFSLDLSWRSLMSGGSGAKDPVVRYGEIYGRREAVVESDLEGVFARLASLLGKRGLRVEAQRERDFIRFAASSGRFRSPGTALFHAGLVVITIGSLVGSLRGWRTMVYLKEGETAPFPPDSAVALRVDDFRIVTTGRMEIRDYISTIAMIGPEGDTLAAGAVEVNHPLRFRGVSIYQSSYTIDRHEYAWARIGYRPRGMPMEESIDLPPGRPTVLGDSLAVVSGVRFLPDFRMGPRGPFTASVSPSNPALEIEVASAAGTERGWLFLRHPDFNKRFAAPVDIALRGIEPVYYTGLEMSSNPGVPLLFAGFAAATLGLLFMYGCNPRVIKGIATREGLLVAGTEYRWRASFEHEFRDLREAIRREFGGGGVAE